MVSSNQHHPELSGHIAWNVSMDRVTSIHHHHDYPELPHVHVEVTQGDRAMLRTLADALVAAHPPREYHIGDTVTRATHTLDSVLVTIHPHGWATLAVGLKYVMPDGGVFYGGGRTPVPDELMDDFHAWINDHHGRARAQAGHHPRPAPLRHLANPRRPHA